MKKYLKYISFCFLAGVGLSSCDSDDNGYREDPINLGGFTYLVDRSISNLDDNADLELRVFSNEGVEVESIEILQEGSSIATANISGETATFNSAALGTLDPDADAFSIRVRSQLSNGRTAEDPASISVGHAIQIDGVEQIRYLDPTSSDETILGYSIDVHSAAIDDFMLEWKRGEEGTFAEETNITLDPAGGEIDLAELDYDAYGLQPGDTLFYRFTATSGSLTDQVVTSTVVVPQDFESSQEGNISNNPGMSQFSFATGENFAEDSDEGEIIFTDPSGFGAVNASDVEFVEITSDPQTFYEEADLMDARDAFNSSLTTQTAVTDVESGEVYVYRITRQIEDEEGTFETVTFYGILQIGDVTTINESDVNFNIEFAEGVIVE